MFLPSLVAAFSLPSLVVGLAIIAVGILLLAFVVKTAVTVVKVAIIVAIGVGVWLGLQTLGVL